MAAPAQPVFPPAILHGHKSMNPADELREMALYVEKHGDIADVYGVGGFLQKFEAQAAKVLGMPEAVFMPSGTMAQQMALRIWVEHHGKSRAVAMHPTAHLEVNEFQGYKHLHQIDAVLVGHKDEPTTAAELDAAAASVPLAAFVLELPIRHAGGKLPTWDEMEKIKKVCRERGIAIHVDGARLWECRPFYGDRTYKEICQHVDSVYVSVYKGIGGVSGCFLAGSIPFVKEARLWLRRHGGNLPTQYPAFISAAMHWDSRLSEMATYNRKAREIAQALLQVPGCRLEPPNGPHINMFHIVVAAPQDVVETAHAQAAQEAGVALRPGKVTRPSLLEEGSSIIELYIGDNAMSVETSAAVSCVSKMLQLVDKAR